MIDNLSHDYYKLIYRKIQLITSHSSMKSRYSLDPHRKKNNLYFLWKH